VENVDNLRVHKQFILFAFEYSHPLSVEICIMLSTIHIRARAGHIHQRGEGTVKRFLSLMLILVLLGSAGGVYAEPLRDGELKIAAPSAVLPRA